MSKSSLAQSSFLPPEVCLLMLRTPSTPRSLPSPVRRVAVTAAVATVASLAALAPAPVASAQPGGASAVALVGSAALARVSPPVSMPPHPRGLPRQATYQGELDEPA